MTTTRTAIAATAGQWTLTGIESTTADKCECCTRKLTQRVFQVSHPTEGVASLGRRCAAKATGYAANAIERELERIAYCAEIDRRKAIVSAEYPELAAAFQRHADAYAAQRAAGFEPHGDATTASCVFQTAYTTDCWWGGRGWAAYDTYAEYIDECMARA